jgi:hypothetical protein
MARRLVCLAMTTSLLLLVAQPARAGGVDPIITGSAYQAAGSSNGTMMTWFQNHPDRPQNYAAYASPLGDTSDPVKLNVRGTRGFTGGFEPGTNTVIYQQASGDRSTLFLYDLDTSIRTRLPDTVNSERWEYDGRISQAFVLFVRAARTQDRLLLWDRAGDTLTELDTATPGESVIFAGVVGERYATWTRCTRRTCLAMYHDTTTDETRRVPQVPGNLQYAPAIDEGTAQIYYVRSGFGCGVNVRIFRSPLADTSSRTLLTTLPDGVDTDWTQYVVPDLETKGELDLWFGRFRCRADDMDVYALRSVQA